MQQIPINWLAVIVAAVIRVALGALWYSKPLFGPQWLAMTNVTQDAWTARLPRAVPTDSLLALVMAFVLVHAVTYAGATDLLTGAAVGALNWLGFMLPVLAGHWSHEGRDPKVVLIMGSYNLVALVLMGALLAVWR